MTTAAPLIPRMSFFGWHALRGPADAGMPCLLDLPHVILTTSGHAAIRLALQALGVGPADAVLLPTYHCPTMVAPVVSVGAEPRFYPINSGGAPDLDWLSSQPLADVRVLLAAHFFSFPQPMDAVRAWCHARGISLIEDCAHALFGSAAGRPMGSWGDAAIGSLTKFMPVSEGGCLVLNRRLPAPQLRRAGPGAQMQSAFDALESAVRQEALPGLNGALRLGIKAARTLGSRGGPAVRAEEAPLRPASPPFHSSEFAANDQSLDLARAARALSWPCNWLALALPRRRIVERRRKAWSALFAAFSGRVALRPLLGPLPPHCAPYVFPLWVQDPDPGYSELRRLQIPVFRWDRPWPGSHASASADDQGPAWSHHVLQLACHQDLSQVHLTRITDAVLRVYHCA